MKMTYLMICSTRPIDSGSNVTLQGRKGTVRYCAVVGSDICPSDTVSTLEMGGQIYSYLTHKNTHVQLQTRVIRLPDIVGSSRYKAVECCLGRAWWFPFLEIPTSYLQLSSGLPFVIINKTIFKKMITIGYGCKCNSLPEVS